jgi:hypothetical protein
MPTVPAYQSLVITMGCQGDSNLEGLVEEKGHLDETRAFWARQPAGEEGLGEPASGSWDGGEALSAPHRFPAHYKHCNLVSAPALIKGSLDTLRPLCSTD